MMEAVSEQFMRVNQTEIKQQQIIILHFIDCWLFSYLQSISSLLFK